MFKNRIFVISMITLSLITATQSVVSALDKVLTPVQKQEYNAMKVQLESFLLSLPEGERGNIKKTEQYLRGIGSPIALRLLDNCKNLKSLCEQFGALFAANKYKEAADKITSAISIDDEIDLLWERRGTCYFQLQRYAEAILDYNKAITLNPQCGFYYASRAICFQSLGNFNAAKNDIMIAASLGEPEAQKIVQAWTNAENARQKQNHQQISRGLEERFGMKPGTLR